MLRVETGKGKGRGGASAPLSPLPHLGAQCLTPLLSSNPQGARVFSPHGAHQCLECHVILCSLSVLSENKLSILSRIPEKTPPKMLTDKSSTVASGAPLQPVWPGHHSCLQWCIYWFQGCDNKNDSRPLPRLLVKDLRGPLGSKAHPNL